MPKKLYLIREILKELDMDCGMAYVMQVYSEMLRQSTRLLFETGDEEAYKRAVRFEIENNFSTTIMSHTMTKELAEKIKVHMYLTNRNVAFIAMQTGLSTSVVTALIEGHGSIENFVTVMMVLGLTLQITDVSSYHKTCTKEEKQNTEVYISPILIEDYIKLQMSFKEQLRDYCEIGGNLNFDVEPVGNDIVVSGLIDYNMTEDESVFPDYKVSSKEFVIALRIYPEMRERLVADYLKKPGTLAISLGNKHIITVEQLLNSLYYMGDKGVYSLLLRIPYRLLDEEGLTIADSTYNITLNVNGVSKTSKLLISNKFITFKGTIPNDTAIGDNTENTETTPPDNSEDTSPITGDDNGATSTDPGDTQQPTDPDGIEQDEGSPSDTTGEYGHPSDGTGDAPIGGDSDGSSDEPTPTDGESDNLTQTNESSGDVTPTDGGNESSSSVGGDA